MICKFCNAELIKCGSSWQGNSGWITCTVLTDDGKYQDHEPAEPAATPPKMHISQIPGNLLNDGITEVVAPADSTPHVCNSDCGYFYCPIENSTRPDPLRDKNPIAMAANEIADFYNQNATMIPQPHHIEAILLRHLAAAPRTQGSEPLQEWRDSVSAAIKAIPEFHSGEWAGDKEGWGFHFEVVRWLQRKREELEKQLAAQPAPRPQFKKDETTGQWYEVCGVNLRPVHKEDVPREFFTAIPAQKEEKNTMENIRVWSIGESSELFAAHSEEEMRKYYTEMVGKEDAEEAFADHFEEQTDFESAHEYDDDGKKVLLTLRDLINMNAPAPCQISTSYN